MLDARGPSDADERWVRHHLGPGELALWAQMCGPDRRHAIGVARATEPLAVHDDAVAAALLHDVGKIEADLGPVGRAVATVVGMLAPRRILAGRGRIGRYLTHDARGAALLAAAGAPDLVVSWAREHHLPADRWTVPVDIATVLKAADDD